MPGTDLQVWAGQDQALAALQDALAPADADHVEVFMAARTGEHTRFAGERVHQPQTIIECQVMVRAVAGTGSARVAVSSLAGARDAVAAASGLARRRDGAVGGGRPHSVAGPGDISSAAGLWHDSTLAWDAGARSALAGRIMDAARSAGVSAAGVLTAAITELAVVTSAGQRCYAAATEAGFSLTARAGEASSYTADLGRDVSALSIEERAETAVSQAAATPNPVPVPDGVHDVVFGGLATAELIGFLPDFGFTGPAAAAGISDLASAVATGGHSTGHAHIARESAPAPEAANLIMTPGTASEADLIAGVERGLYIQRLWYNRLVDAEAGTVVGTSRDGCFLIEDGKLTAGLRTGRFTESVLGALARTDGIGSRLITLPVPNVWNGCSSAPAIRVRGFRFGSRPATH
jgi:PmbA protein